MKRIGWLGTCSTPYCGSIQGVFCVRCHHYTSGCDCGDCGKFECECPDTKGHAGPGERQIVLAQLANGYPERKGK